MGQAKIIALFRIFSATALKAIFSVIKAVLTRFEPVTSQY